MHPVFGLIFEFWFHRSSLWRFKLSSFQVKSLGLWSHAGTSWGFTKGFTVSKATFCSDYGFGNREQLRGLFSRGNLKFRILISLKGAILGRWMRARVFNSVFNPAIYLVCYSVVYTMIQQMIRQELKERENLQKVMSGFVQERDRAKYMATKATINNELVIWVTHKLRIFINKFFSF